MVANTELIILITNSIIVSIAIVILIAKFGIEEKVSRFFIASCICLLIATIADMTMLSIYNIYNVFNTFAIKVGFVGYTFVPVFVFMIAWVFSKKERKTLKIFLLIIVIPIISNIVSFTNEYHGLFIQQMSLYDSDTVYGKYFYIHQVYSYLLIGISAFLFLKFTIRNIGFFSKQSILFFIAILFPVFVDLLSTFKIYTGKFFSISVTYSITIILLAIAILKFDFLKIIPIAMKTVVDRISDCVLVLDQNMNIIDYNKTFYDVFEEIFEIKIGKKFDDSILRKNTFDSKKLIANISKIIKDKNIGEFEYHFQTEGNTILNDRYFSIEVTSITYSEKQVGIIVLLKDVTEHKKHIETIKDQHEHIIEKERLASLGALMGGISHNMKTPLVSISGCIAALEDLIKEYSESIGNASVNEQDHLEIVADMNNWMLEMKKHFNYIGSAITTIKDHTVKSGLNENANFSIKEAIEGIEFLLKYELKTNHCILQTDVYVGNDQKIKGDKGTFIQIINNLISNAIQSYEKSDNIENKIDLLGRKIEFKVNKIDNFFVFSVKDFGKGISQDIKEKLFKDMVTSKGKDGTGIGLYMSYSKIKGLFKGDMWFESEEGNGTSFYIKIPEYIS